MSRPKHGSKDVERELRVAEAAGWVFTRRSGHWIFRCACGAHSATIYSTPRVVRLPELRRELRCAKSRG